MSGVDDGAAPAAGADPRPGPRDGSRSGGRPGFGGRPARVLLLVTELLPAGAERVVFELATRLPRARWEVRVCSLRSPGGEDGAVARELLAAGVPVQPLRFQGKLDVRSALRLARELASFRPDVLHAHLFHANLAARLLGRAAGARRVLSTVHVVERRPLRARRLLERLTARRDDLTVCVSNTVADHARADLGVRRERLRVVENGVDLARFASPEPAAAARAALGLPPTGLVVGAVGRLSRQKGFDVLLEAFARLLRARSDVHLVIAGAGEEEAALRARARTLGLGDRARLLGFRPDTPRVLAALDVFCMPSRWEGFGLALVEALAAGRPAVVSAVDSLPEVLGGAGLLVAPDDPSGLAAGLEQLLSDPSARAALAGRARARAARYGVERMVAGYEALYLELLNAGPPV